jgi:Spore Coat Protein U domain
MKTASLVLVVGLLGLCFGTMLALSATRSSSFSVTLTAQSTCQIDSRASDVGEVGAATANPRSLVSVSCSNPTPYDVSFSAGRFTSTPPGEAPIMVLNSGAAWSRRLTAAESNARTRFQRTEIIGLDRQFAQDLMADDEALGLHYVHCEANADTVVVTVIY